MSRVLPYKNKTLKVKNKKGIFEKVPIRVMEWSLMKTYKKFMEDHPDLTIDRRSFEKQRPRNVKLKRCAQRFVCACSYHLNVEYLRQALFRLLKLNKVDNFMVADNEAMMEYLLCEKSITCILGHCNNCKGFDKLSSLFTANMKCCKDCMVKGVDCVNLNHTIKIRQFEKVLYNHQGKEKKKVSLVDKH